MSEYLEKSKRYKGYHYSELEPGMLKYLHDKTLEMLKVIIPIFEEANDIRYMICGGTLLGAATTGEFIPWDDDVDICVLDDDYEKMTDCLLREVPDWILVQCRQTEPNYYHGWIKVRDKMSSVYPGENSYACNGVWVDIYKLTKTKKKDVKYQITKEHLDYLCRRMKGGGISIREMLKRIFSNKLITKMVKEKAYSACCADKTSVYVIWSASKILVEPEWCFPSTQYMFEGLQLKSFHKADAYLRRHYGDQYRELPPDEKRRVGINMIVNAHKK